VLNNILSFYGVLQTNMKSTTISYAGLLRSLEKSGKMFFGLLVWKKKITFQT